MKETPARIREAGYTYGEEDEIKYAHYDKTTMKKKRWQFEHYKESPRKKICCYLEDEGEITKLRREADEVDKFD